MFDDIIKPKKKVWGQKTLEKYGANRTISAKRDSQKKSPKVIKITWKKCLEEEMKEIDKELNHDV